MKKYKCRGIGCRRFIERTNDSIGKTKNSLVFAQCPACGHWTHYYQGKKEWICLESGNNLLKKVGA
tara:strand:+ start:87 stop:284 length:198 start_codon:yes stop_codon:yes gene_type:complete